MTASRLAWPALMVWVLTPLAVLVVRAVGRGWPFPALLPSGVSGGALLPLADARLLDALMISLALAVWTGVTSSALGFMLARSLVRAGRAARAATLAFALLSVVAPPVALALGLQVAMLGLGLSGTMSGVYLAHLVPATGYLTLFAAGVFSAYDFAVHDEARTLGATPWQVALRVTWPLLRPRIVEGALPGGLVSWGQLALTLLVGGGLVRTLPVELLGFLRAGDDQLGAAAALVLTVPPLLGLGLVQTATRRAGTTW